jgi:hypothetical protein
MNHSFEADYFALGVIVYEMMMGLVTILLLSDPILERLGNKLEIKFLHIRQKYPRSNYQMVGVSNQ